MGMVFVGHDRAEAHHDVFVEDAQGRRLARVQDAVHALLGALRRPVRAVLLLGGSALGTLGYALALAACLHAFGARVSLERVAAAFLGASALASAAPTPGGLGAGEAAFRSLRRRGAI